MNMLYIQLDVNIILIVKIDIIEIHIFCIHFIYFFIYFNVFRVHKRYSNI